MYHALFRLMGEIINSNLNLLRMDNKVKKLFTPGPMISFRIARRMSSYFVSAKFYIQKKEIKVTLSVVVSTVRFV